MNTIIQQSELLRRVIRWIDGERHEKPQKKLHDLIDEAGMRFNLSPQDCVFLLDFFDEPKKASPE